MIETMNTGINGRGIVPVIETMNTGDDRLIVHQQRYRPSDRNNDYLADDTLGD